MDVGGNCPVQGYAIEDGWLYYFRARDSWSLSAWPPGTWVERSSSSPEAAAYASVEDADDLLDPPIYIEEQSGAGFPVVPPTEESYPGWWSREYAGQVARWAIAEVRRRCDVTERPICDGPASASEVLAWAATLAVDGCETPSDVLVRVQADEWRGDLHPNAAIVWALCVRAGLPVAGLIQAAAPRWDVPSQSWTAHAPVARAAVVEAAAALTRAGDPLGELVTRFVGVPAVRHQWTLGDLARRVAAAG